MGLGIVCRLSWCRYLSEGDGAVCGEKLVCLVGITQKEKASIKAKHWILLGLTAFDGTPVICIVIFAGKQNVPLYETGMDPFTNIKGNPIKVEFFDINSAPGKLYLGGPKFTYTEMRHLARTGGPPRAVLTPLF